MMLSSEAARDGCRRHRPLDHREGDDLGTTRPADGHHHDPGAEERAHRCADERVVLETPRDRAPLGLDRGERRRPTRPGPWSARALHDVRPVLVGAADPAGSTGRRAGRPALGAGSLVERRDRRCSPGGHESNVAAGDESAVEPRVSPVSATVTGTSVGAALAGGATADDAVSSSPPHAARSTVATHAATPCHPLEPIPPSRRRCITPSPPRPVPRRQSDRSFGADGGIATRTLDVLR